MSTIVNSCGSRGVFICSLRLRCSAGVFAGKLNEARRRGRRARSGTHVATVAFATFTTGGSLTRTSFPARPVRRVRRYPSSHIPQPEQWMFFHEEIKGGEI